MKIFLAGASGVIGGAWFPGLPGPGTTLRA